jgi:hypothetical protein
LTLIKDGFALLCFDNFLKFYSAAIRGELMPWQESQRCYREKEQLERALGEAYRSQHHFAV